jgi:proline iminopeptidase
MSDILAPEARPVYVEILRNARRIASPEGVEELVEVPIDNGQQWVSIRGKDARNPVLLFVHGGPGSPEMPVSWLYQHAWEDYFVVVQWDQRGCGKSAGAAWPAQGDGVSFIDRMVADAREMVAFLRDRFDREKVFVLGHSWGTVIGTSLARNCPEWLYAYVGVGQVIDWGENERASYAYVMQQAQKLGQTEAISELAAIAPYPDTLPTASAIERLLIERKWVVQLGGMIHGCKGLTSLEHSKILCPDYSTADLNMSGQVEAAVGWLLPELMRYDCREIGQLHCPVAIAAGRFDFATPSSVALEWYEKLEAPRKSWMWFERSAHMPHLEEPGRFLNFLANEVRLLA